MSLPTETAGVERRHKHKWSFFLSFFLLTSLKDGFVGINEDHPTENTVCLFRTYCSKGVSHHCLCLAKKQRQAGEWKSFRVEKKGQVLGIL